MIENNVEGWQLVNETMQSDKASIFPKIREARIKAEEQFLDRTKDYRKLKARKEAEEQERRE